MGRNGVTNTIYQGIPSNTISTVGLRFTSGTVSRARRTATLTVWILSVYTIYKWNWIVGRASRLTSCTLSTVSCSDQNYIADLTFITVSRTSSIALNTVGSARSADSSYLTETESCGISWDTISWEATVSWETSCGVRIWTISTFSTNQKLSRIARSTGAVSCARTSLAGSITSDEGSTDNTASRTSFHTYNLSSWWYSTLSAAGWAVEILSCSTDSHTLSVTNTHTGVVKS